ncbi:IPT/TIG domain-containing protein [Rhodocytophaga aerolata]|uniref:IPT/TIG domain-containing protein n=1 Tax=Rhodocytophaga aerolata TaxID=455078 RepID=A0ABT8RKD2_9BACT|nr:IPT/TIG domain-containing protein [Rhodocytophaga aerolata]MDO1451823.1 IPT/TIG domain-containing protein [Rhodocytophaga aerolata]
MKLYLHRVYVLSIILLFFNLSACKKDNQDPVVQPPKVDPTVPEPVAPTITTITPDNGISGTAVTITGTGFSTVLTENVVTLNDKKCTVTAATSTSLTITIPPGAGSGNIVVTTNSKSAKSASPFRYMQTITVTTVAGSSQGYADGEVMNAKFWLPHSITTASDGTIYITEFANRRIRKISPNGIVSTVAGDGLSGYTDGPAAQAQFAALTGIAIASDGTLYVSDNHMIRKITPDGIVSTLAGSSQGYADGPAAQALFTYPTGIKIANDGTLYIVDGNGNRIRKISPNGIVSTVAGNGTKGYTDGPAAQAQFEIPYDIAVASDGTLYVVEGHMIRKITPDGIVSTLAGSRERGIKNGVGIEARFYDPMGIAVASNGTLYVTESSYHRIREITPDGVVTTLAGGPFDGYADGTATEARFYQPKGITIANDSTLYVVDHANHKIRKITMR